LYKAPSPTEFFFAQFLVLEILGNLSVEIFSAFFSGRLAAKFLAFNIRPLFTFYRWTDGARANLNATVWGGVE